MRAEGDIRSRHRYDDFCFSGRQKKQGAMACLAFPLTNRSHSRRGLCGTKATTARAEMLQVQPSTTHHTQRTLTSADPKSYKGFFTLLTKTISQRNSYAHFQNKAELHIFDVWPCAIVSILNFRPCSNSNQGVLRNFNKLHLSCNKFSSIIITSLNHAIIDLLLNC